MSYDYSYTTSTDESVGIAFLMIFLGVGLVALIIGLVMYIFDAIGVHTIAKRRGIKHAWLAWIPIGRVWMVGCIADQYQYLAYGKNKNRRTILLVLSLVSFILSAMTSGQMAGGLTELIMNADYMNETDIMAAAMSMTGGSGLTSILSLVLAVFQYIALYDLFQSCNPENSTLFLVLSIILGFLRPFFVFASRNKDLGIPAKQEAPQTYQPLEEPKEPWGNI